MALRPIGIDPSGAYHVQDDETGEDMFWPSGIPEADNAWQMLNAEEEDRRLASNDVPLNPMEFQRFEADERARAEAERADVGGPIVGVTSLDGPGTSPEVQGMMPTRSVQAHSELPVKSVDSLSKYERPELPQQQQPGQQVPRAAQRAPQTVGELQQVAGSLAPDPGNYVRHVSPRDPSIGGRDVETVRSETEDIYKTRKRALAEREAASKATQQAIEVARLEGQQRVENTLAQAQERERKAQEQFQKRMREANQADERLSEMRIDPERYWNDKGTWGRITAALALAFGAAQQAKTGGPNVGYQIIKDAIDRDIEAQMRDIEAGKDLAEGKRSAVAMAYQQLGDVRAAGEIAKRNAYEYAGQAVDEVMQNNQLAMQSADFTAMRAQLMEDRQQAEFALQSIYDPGRHGGSYLDREALRKDTEWNMKMAERAQGLVHGQQQTEKSEMELRAGPSGDPKIQSQISAATKRLQEIEKLETTIEQAERVPREDWTTRWLDKETLETGEEYLGIGSSKMEARETLENAIGMAVLDKTGATATDEERANERDIVGNTPQSQERYLQRTKERLEQEKMQIMNSLSDPALQEIQRRQRRDASMQGPERFAR